MIRFTTAQFGRDPVHLLGQREDLIRQVQQLQVLLVFLLTVFHSWSAITCCLAAARFWLIIT